VQKQRWSVSAAVGDQFTGDRVDTIGSPGVEIFSTCPQAVFYDRQFWMLGDVVSQLQPALPRHADGNGGAAGHVPDAGGDTLWAPAG
jgi:hypothetical protein